MIILNSKIFILNSKRGITLLEILFVLTIMGFLSVLGLWYFSKATASESLRKDILGLKSMFAEARSLSISSKDASKYGVHVEEFQAALFKGSSYNSSAADNEYYKYNSAVHMLSHNFNGGGDEILFSRLTGETSNYGSVTLSLINASTSSTTLTVNANGVVE